MKFKPIKYNSGEGIAHIRMEDETGALVENWKLMWSDLSNWVRLMESKYGINFKKKQVDHDLDWIR